MALVRTGFAQLKRPDALCFWAFPFELRGVAAAVLRRGHLECQPRQLSQASPQSHLIIATLVPYSSSVVTSKHTLSGGSRQVFWYMSRNLILSSTWLRNGTDLAALSRTLGCEMPGELNLVHLQSRRRGGCQAPTRPTNLLSSLTRPRFLTRGCWRGHDGTAKDIHATVTLSTQPPLRRWLRGEQSTGKDLARHLLRTSGVKCDCPSKVFAFLVRAVTGKRVNGAGLTLCF